MAAYFHCLQELCQRVGEREIVTRTWQHPKIPQIGGNRPCRHLSTSESLALQYVREPCTAPHHEPGGRAS
jgi:hypothetical protein